MTVIGMCSDEQRYSVIGQNGLVLMDSSSSSTWIYVFSFTDRPGILVIGWNLICKPLSFTRKSCVYSKKSALYTAKRSFVILQLVSSTRPPLPFLHAVMGDAPMSLPKSFLRGLFLAVKCDLVIRATFRSFRNRWLQPRGTTFPLVCPLSFPTILNLSHCSTRR